MGKFSLETYRKHWPRVGGVLAMALGGAAALAAGKTSNTRLISMLNWGALLVHQYEEYQDPGYFPGQFNKGMLGSEDPARYPLNAHGTLCVNTVLAYPFYLAPALFPKVKWLGIGPVLFGMTQVVGHGIIIPRRAGDRYSPGFLASILLHLPLGIAYFRALKQEQGGVTRSDMAKGVAYAVGFAVVGVVGPNIGFYDKNSPYAFTRHQLGHHAPPENP
ncbi:HXXEE domain-containing protein [Nonomuraea sp. NPDC050404]|uniref:HXXEE domain-containing protein n=1 Tax=Nonomuraea sp. NPDC050404 TaxID=3155783 RepID=UPI0033DF3865